MVNEARGSKLQQHLPTAHVVKVFNNITYWHLLALAAPSPQHLAHPAPPTLAA
jgi:predicted dinucleotide-binding enzyme